MLRGLVRKAAVHVYIESGDGGKEVQSLSVDVSVVVADDWEEPSAKCITTLSYLARLAALYLLMASLPMLGGQVVTTIPTSIQRRPSPNSASGMTYCSLPPPVKEVLRPPIRAEIPSELMIDTDQVTDDSVVAVGGVVGPSFSGS